jgi:hypothetical protein
MTPETIQAVPSAEVGPIRVADAASAFARATGNTSGGAVQAANVGEDAADARIRADVARAKRCRVMNSRTVEYFRLW